MQKIIVKNTTESKVVNDVLMAVIDLSVIDLSEDSDSMCMLIPMTDLNRIKSSDNSNQQLINLWSLRDVLGLQDENNEEVWILPTTVITDSILDDDRYSTVDCEVHKFDQDLVTLREYGLLRLLDDIHNVRVTYEIPRDIWNINTAYTSAGDFSCFDLGKHVTKIEAD